MTLSWKILYVCENRKSASFTVNDMMTLILGSIETPELNHYTVSRKMNGVCNTFPVLVKRYSVWVGFKWNGTSCQFLAVKCPQAGVLLLSIFLPEYKKGFWV